MGKPLERLMLATIETIVEGIEKEPWHAFINNTFDFTGVVFNNKELVQEIAEAKSNPSILEALETKASEKWGAKYDDSIAKNIFQLVWAALLYNAGTVLEIKNVIEGHNEEMARK